MMTKKIFWSPKEKQLVINEFHRLTTEDGEAVANKVWLAAQLVLPEDRRRTMASQATTILNKEYKELVDCGYFLHKNAVSKQEHDWELEAEKPKLQAITPKTEAKPAMFAMSALQMLSVPHTPPPPPPVAEVDVPVAEKIIEKVVEVVKSESTIDFLLKALVYTIVRDVLSEFEVRQSNLLADHQRAIQGMFDSQIAKLVDLWEPAKPSASKLQIEIKDSRSKDEPVGVPKANHLSPPVPQPLPEKACGEAPEPKPKKFKVFYAGGTNSDFQTLVRSMPNVDFTHGDGRNPRSLTMGPSIDLVVCCKFLGHTAQDALKAEYGERFKFIKKGGMTTIKQVIRDYFSTRMNSQGATTC